MTDRSFLQDHCLASTTTYMDKTIKKEVGFQFMVFTVCLLIGMRNTRIGRRNKLKEDLR